MPQALKPAVLVPFDPARLKPAEITAAGISAGTASEAPAGPRLPASSLLDALVWRPTLYRRKAVRYVSLRSWRKSSRKADIAALKRAKAHLDDELIAAAAGEIAGALATLFGPAADLLVTNVPCGHSRRPDCFGKRLAIATAGNAGARFLQIHADRFVSGVSHPKEFAQVDPLVRIATADRATILVDDVSTSGWHMEESLMAIRDQGVAAFGVVWIAGVVEG